MTLAHRHWHVRAWVVIGAFLAVGVVVGLVNRPKPEIQMPLDSLSTIKGADR